MSNLIAVKQFIRNAWVTAAMGKPARESMRYTGSRLRMTIAAASRDMWSTYSRIAGIPSDAVTTTDGDFVAEWDSYVDFFFSEAMRYIIPNYEVRNSQLAMSRVVQRAIEMGDVAVINAPTGTGKSLAYLVPAMRAKAQGKIIGSVVISTSNKALQRQIIEDDLPKMADIFPNLSVVGLKGRNNYICEVRLSNANLNQELHDELSLIPNGEIDEIPLTAETRAAIQVGDITCAGCTVRSQCRFQKQRAAARKADVVIINHASLAIGLVNPFAASFPQAGVIIVDEAHKLGGFIRDALGQKITQRSMELLTTAIESQGELAPKMENAWEDLMGMAKDENGTVDCDAIAERADKLAMELLGIQKDLTPQGFPPCSDEDRERLAVANRVEKFRERLQALSRASEEGECRWIDAENEAIEMTQVDISEFCKDAIGYVEGVPRCSACGDAMGGADYLLYRRPICIECMCQSDVDEADIISMDDYDVQPIDRRPLAPVWVFASATLEVSLPEPHTGVPRPPSLNAFCNSMGIPFHDGKPLAMTLSTPSPFDHGKNVMLYVPPDMPKPVFNTNDHTYAAIGHMRQLVEKSRGGALILFSSNFALKQCYDALHKPFGKLGYNVMQQGDMPKGAIVEAMRTGMSSVTFATKSFFEGVDVPTLSLRLVILHKIPFEAMTPLNIAKENACTEEGRRMGLTGDRLKYHPFTQIRVVDATLEMQQAYGRLVRRDTDRGVVACLDPRLMSTHYGRSQIGPSLPVRATGETEMVMAFLEKLADEAGAQDVGVLETQTTIPFDM